MAKLSEASKRAIKKYKTKVTASNRKEAQTTARKKARAGGASVRSAAGNDTAAKAAERRKKNKAQISKTNSARMKRKSATSKKTPTTTSKPSPVRQSGSSSSSKPKATVPSAKDTASSLLKNAQTRVQRPLMLKPSNRSNAATAGSGNATQKAAQRRLGRKD